MTGYATNELLALALAVAFAAGLNVYAVLATLGLLAQADLVTLPGGLSIVESWWVIGAALVLYSFEFIADKIPLFDLAWNVLQFFVRVPVAALLTFAATDRLPLELQIVATIAGGALAVVSSGTKLAVRGAATASPEPFSNIALSVIEDMLAVGVTWFATQYPWLAASIVLVLLIVAALVAKAIVSALTAVFRRARGNPTAASSQSADDQRSTR